MFLSVVADKTVAFAFLAALLAALALTPIARAVARRLKVVDVPDGARKCHDRPVPLWGGIAVYLAIAVGVLVARYGPVDSAAFDQFSTTVILACGLVCLVGCIDDSHDLPARFKLMLQVGSVMPVVLAGYYFDRVVAFGYPIDLGWLGIPLTILWLVGCINALNLLDGLDGLASVVGISASLMMAIIATNSGHPHVGIVALLAAGSLAGFLVYNLPPASIFLGDSGSMVIGLLVGMISIQGALKTSATLSIAVPAVVMSIPMLDTVFAIVRRKLSGQRFDTADRGHIHHRLLERGLTKWQALCIIGALCLTTGAAATAATIFRFEWVGWITAIALIVLLVRTRSFGHHEVALAKQHCSAVLARWSATIAKSTTRWTRAHPQATWQRAWHELLHDEIMSQAAGFELLLATRAEQARYSWRNPMAIAPTHAQLPLALTFTQPNGTMCQLQLLGLRPASETHDVLPRVTALLNALVQTWQPTDEALMPPAGVECHRIVVDSWRRAA
jgi:UDP-GlcNAc:undecaprenyl-phosphate GlcNAc-1-phosphate transferase